jgi:hypothetical protein
MEEYYVLISDSDEIPALFKITDGFEKIRMNGEWVDPTVDQLAELDGLLVATITEEFVPIYDEIQSREEIINKQKISDYLAESD